MKVHTKLGVLKPQHHKLDNQEYERLGGNLCSLEIL